MDYRDKYLKYKKKYIKYKKLLSGGGDYIFDNITYNNCNSVKDDNSSQTKIKCENIFVKLNNKDSYTQYDVKWDVFKKNNFAVGNYNDGDNVYWENERDTIIGENKNIKTTIINVELNNYDNCKIISTTEFFNSDSFKLEKAIYDIVETTKIDQDVINNLEKQLSDLEKIHKNLNKKMYAELNDNSNIGSDEITEINNQIIITKKEILDNKIKSISTLLDNKYSNLSIKTFINYLNKYKSMFDNIYKIIHNKYQYIYFIDDSKIIMYCIYNTQLKKYIGIYPPFESSIDTLDDPDKINIIKQYLNNITFICIKFVIENHKLKTINNDCFPYINNDSIFLTFCKKKTEKKTYEILHNNNLLFKFKYYYELQWILIPHVPTVLEILNFTDYNTNLTSKTYISSSRNKIQRFRNRFNGYITYNTDEKVFDFNNLKLFINNEWLIAKDYQIWAYLNFIMSDNNKDEITYCSKYNHSDNKVIIDVHGIDKEILFSIKYNDYSSIQYIENNNIIFISDNDRVRRCNSMVNNYYLKKSNAKYIEKFTAGNIIDYPHGSNWFEKIFGFKETSNYLDNKTNIENKYTKINNEEFINEINCGIFEIFDCMELHQLLDISSISQIPTNNIVVITNITGDITVIHSDEKNANCTIQVASQLNCLEMSGLNKIPENGITIYIDDHTQGPACAMCAPAGLAYRNYIYNGGQTAKKQIDMSKKLLEFLQSIKSEIEWESQNGYLFFEKTPKLKIINELLNNTDVFEKAKKLIEVGSHRNQGVVVNNKKCDYLINHVYCSGLPISYNYDDNNINDWENLSKLFLEGIYENTLLIAIMNNLLSGEDKPCYLTQVGGGVFGMKHEHIIEAINKACITIKNLGFSLTIYLVHYGSINDTYSDFKKKFFN